MKHLCYFKFIPFAVIFLQLVSAQQLSAPQFTSEPSNTTAFTSANLSCSVSGNPAPSVSWLKDGSPLDLSADSRLQQTSAGTLMVTGLQENNGEELGGVYQCSASNSVGVVLSRPATLQRTVWSPGFSSPLQTQQLTVVRYSSLRLPCMMPQASVPPATVIWSSDTNAEIGIPLDGGLLFAFFFRTVHGDAYSCTIINPVSGESAVSSRYTIFETTAGASLTHSPEFIVTPPSQQTVVAGDTVTLECFTSGRPVPTIEWSRNGSPLSSGDDGRVSLPQGARQLQISQVQPQDAGTYRCQASSTLFQSPVSAAGEVAVLVPPNITSAFPEMHLNATQSLSISCSAEGTAPLRWVWLLNGNTLSSTPSHSFTTEGSMSTLTIPSLEEENGGVFQCRVDQPTTGRSTAHHQWVEVRVILPVIQTPTFRDVIGLLGSTLTLPCVASAGLPVPNFLWFRGTNTLVDPNQDPRVMISALPGNGTLTISNAMITDSSVYRCEANNSINNPPTVSDLMNLRVIANPVIQRRPVNLIPQEGEMVTLECSATISGVVLRYEWIKNNVPLGLVESGNFVIPSVSAADVGAYECILVLTIDGLDAAPLRVSAGTATLTIGDPMPPSPPHSLTSVPNGARSFTANWEAPEDDGGLPILDYTVEILNMGNQEFCPQPTQAWQLVARVTATEAVITAGVYSSFQYQFRVTAFNHLFNTTSTPSPTFTTLAAVPREPPSSVTVVASNTTALIISWAPPTSCLDYGGPLTSYSIQYRSPSSDFEQVVVLDTVTRHTLTGLQPDTLYEIRVAVSTAEGMGPFSPAIMKATLPADVTSTNTPPHPMPSNIALNALNSSAFQITWERPPPSTTGGTLLSYRITIVRMVDGTTSIQEVDPEINSYIFTDLEPGEYIVTVIARYEGDNYSQPHVSTITVSEEQVGTDILSQVWFYVAVAAGGVFLLLLGITVILVCICCQLRHKGKSSDAYAVAIKSSKNSTENRNNLPHVRVHHSPTPSHRSADYAVPGLQAIAQQQSGPPPPSTGPSSANFSSNVSTPQLNTRSNEQGNPHGNSNGHLHGNHGVKQLHNNHSNGHVCEGSLHIIHQSNGHLQNSNIHGNFHSSHSNNLLHQGNGHMQTGTLLSDSSQHQFQPYQDFSPSPHDLSLDESSDVQSSGENPADHIRHESIATTQNFMDTLSRIHTPPPNRGPSQQHSLSSSHLTEDHRTAGRHGPPPQHFSSSYLAKTLSDDKQEPPWNPGEFLNARGHMTGSSTAVAARSDSFRSTESSNSMEFRTSSQLGKWGTDNYLTRVDEIRKQRDKPSNLLHNQRSAELDHVDYPSTLDQYYSDQPVNATIVPTYQPDVHVSHSTMVEQIPPTHGYAVPPSRAVQQLQQAQKESSVYRHPPPPYAAPPPPDEDHRHSPPHHMTKGTQHSTSPPVATIYNEPPDSIQVDRHAMGQELLQNNIHYNTSTNTAANLQQHAMENSVEMHNIHYSSSTGLAKPASEVQHLHVLQLGPGRTVAPPTVGLMGGHHEHTSSSSSINSAWSLDKIQQAMEKKACSFNDMLEPLEEYPYQQDTHQSNPDTTNRSLSMSNVTKPPRPQVAPKPTGLSGRSNSTSTNMKTQLSNIKEKNLSPPPDIIQSSGNRGYRNGSHGYSGDSSDDEDPTSIAINKRKVKVPDLTVVDPRRPKLKEKKVKGSVWKPYPATRAIESSSSDSDSERSDYSRDTVVANGDTSTLRSAHV